MDHDELAEKVAAKVAEKIHGGTCPMGWTPEDARTLSEFAQTLRAAKSTALTTLVGLLIAFLLYAMISGLPTAWLKHQANGP